MLNTPEWPTFSSRFVRTGQSKLVERPDFSIRARTLCMPASTGRSGLKITESEFPTTPLPRLDLP